jgi:hypothetical protein
MASRRWSVALPMILIAGICAWLPLALAGGFLGIMLGAAPASARSPLCQSLAMGPALAICGLLAVLTNVSRFNDVVVWASIAVSWVGIVICVRSMRSRVDAPVVPVAPVVSDEVPDELPDEVPVVPSEVPSEVPGEVPSEVPDEVPDEVPGEVPDEVPDEVPEGRT